MKKLTIAIALLALAAAEVHADKAGAASPPALACAGATQASINVQVCGGATGAPAGFSIQWMTTADYAANGSSWFSSDDPRLCKASFSGNASLSRYNLAAGECIVVNLGHLLFDNGASANCTGALSCGTEHVFRSFAHATSTLGRSDFSTTLSCSTLACGSGSGCTRPPDAWRFFNPTFCGGSATGNCLAWPVSSLTLGNVSYSVEQIVSILNTSAFGSNGLIALAHQLIAAKLSIANGADPSAVASTIAAADALIGDLVVPPVGGDFLDAGVTSAYTTTLASYVEGAIGPGMCPPPDPGLD